MPIWEANKSVVEIQGTWSTGASRYGPGVAYITAQNVGASATYTVKGTTVKIYTLLGHTPSGSRAAFTYSIDGAPPVTVGATQESEWSVVTTTVAGLAAGSHSVKIAWAGTIDGASQFLSICGVSGENDHGIVVDNLAKSGATTAFYGDPTPASINAVWNGGSAYPADLVIYTAAPNDAQGNVSGDAWTKNVAKFLTAVKKPNQGATDVMIALPHIGNHDPNNFVYQDYAIRAEGLARAYGAAFIDLWTVGRNSWDYWNSLGYWGTLNPPGAAGTDTVHPSDVGHKAIADLITPILAR
ncbi:SGNH/GDSL hydrolase family protein [Streptomyces halstedii]|uniref:SGNH/GDSL hydrolase family protein n=1 Tax=Streptomyces halstedii TaxID=1944 RepID=UPI0037F3D997